jgi:hypothetical protein
LHSPAKTVNRGEVEGKGYDPGRRWADNIRRDTGDVDVDHGSWRGSSASGERLVLLLCPL